MTDKELKEKIADIVMDAIEEYNSNEPNRPMIASLYANKIIASIDSLQQEPHKELYDKLSKLTEDALAKETKESWNEFLDNKPVSEGLDEAAEEYLPYPCPMWYAGDDSGYENAEREVNIRREAFKAGAKWQLRKTRYEKYENNIGNLLQTKM